MKDKGVEFDIFFYVVRIDGFVFDDWLDEVFVLFKDMKVVGCFVDKVMYCIFIWVVYRVGDIEFEV